MHWEPWLVRSLKKEAPTETIVHAISCVSDDQERGWLVLTDQRIRWLGKQPLFGINSIAWPIASTALSVTRGEGAASLKVSMRRFETSLVNAEHFVQLVGQNLSASLKQRSRAANSDLVLDLDLDGCEQPKVGHTFRPPPPDPKIEEARREAEEAASEAEKRDVLNAIVGLAAFILFVAGAIFGARFGSYIAMEHFLTNFDKLEVSALGLGQEFNWVGEDFFWDTSAGKKAIIGTIVGAALGVAAAREIVKSLRRMLDLDD